MSDEATLMTLVCLMRAYMGIVFTLRSINIKIKMKVSQFYSSMDDTNQIQCTYYSTHQSCNPSTFKLRNVKHLLPHGPYVIFVSLKNVHADTESLFKSQFIAEFGGVGVQFTLDD